VADRPNAPVRLIAPWSRKGKDSSFVSESRLWINGQTVGSVRFEEGSSVLTE